ncbi:MAG: prephenate dehydratase [Ignavibacteriales bacterium]
MSKYAVLGPQGTFTEEAALKIWSARDTLIYAPEIGEVFNLVVNRQVDGGLVPFCNSQAGSIPATIAGLLNHQVYISAEVVLPVRHCMLGPAGLDKDDVEVVISQPAVFLQCERFLRSKMPNVRKEIVDSTARAAILIKEDGRKAAAIGPSAMAKVYGLNILAKGLEDETSNCTTFIYITPEQCIRADCNKSSLAFSLKDTPGALYNALGVFERRGINMSRLESRPRSPGSADYMFFVDIEGGISEGHIEEALKELQVLSSFYKYLGSYRMWS